MQRKLIGLTLLWGACGRSCRFARRFWGVLLSIGTFVAAAWQFARCRHSGPLGLLPPMHDETGALVPARWYCDRCGNSWPAVFERDQQPITRFAGYDESKAPAASRRADELARRQRALAMRRAGIATGLSAERRAAARPDPAEIVPIAKRRRFGQLGWVERSMPHALTDHETIRRWAEARGVRPAAVVNPDHPDDAGLEIRLTQPGAGAARARRRRGAVDVGRVVPALRRERPRPADRGRRPPAQHLQQARPPFVAAVAPGKARAAFAAPVRRARARARAGKHTRRLFDCALFATLGGRGGVLPSRAGCRHARLGGVGGMHLELHALTANVAGLPPYRGSRPRRGLSGGDDVKVASIAFTGNSAFPDKTLQRLLVTKCHGPLAVVEAALLQSSDLRGRPETAHGVLLRPRLSGRESRVDGAWTSRPLATRCT